MVIHFGNSFPSCGKKRSALHGLTIDRDMKKVTCKRCIALDNQRRVGKAAFIERTPLAEQPTSIPESFYSRRPTTLSDSQVSALANCLFSVEGHFNELAEAMKKAGLPKVQAQFLKQAQEANDLKALFENFPTVDVWPEGKPDEE